MEIVTQSVCAGFGRFHVMLLFYCGCAWAADAVEMMLLSFLGPAVRALPFTKPYPHMHACGILACHLHSPAKPQCFA